MGSVTPAQSFIPERIQPEGVLSNFWFGSLKVRFVKKSMRILYFQFRNWNATKFCFKTMFCIRIMTRRTIWIQTNRCTSTAKTHSSIPHSQTIWSRWQSRLKNTTTYRTSIFASTSSTWNCSFLLFFGFIQKLFDASNQLTRNQNHGLWMNWIKNNCLAEKHECAKYAKTIYKFQASFFYVEQQVAIFFWVNEINFFHSSFIQCLFIAWLQEPVIQHFFSNN